MVSLLNDKFGYLLATIQREVEPENVVPHSASFDDIKSMFGNEIPMFYNCVRKSDEKFHFSFACEGVCLKQKACVLSGLVSMTLVCHLDCC